MKAAVETVAHEGRHAYQDHCIYYPEDHPEIDQAQIDLWRDNFANYIPPDVDYAKYRSQPIEVDAFDFEVSISEALNIPNLSRSAMPAQEHNPDLFQHSGNRRKAPPAREDGPTFVTPSANVPVKRETVTGHNIQESRLHDHRASSKPVIQTESIPRDPEQAFSRHAEQLQ